MTNTYVRLYSNSLNEEFKIPIEDFEASGGIRFYQKNIWDIRQIGEVTE